MMLKLIILSVLLVGLAVVLLGVKVLFVRGGRFPSSHVHNNPEMLRRGIGCASADH